MYTIKLKIVLEGAALLVLTNSALEKITHGLYVHHLSEPGEGVFIAREAIIYTNAL